MKAFLLAAGKGTRLRPVTDSIPKCLVSINGEPLLGIWLDLCQRNGISHVHINLHYLPNIVEDYLKNSSFDLNISTSYEEELLGSAGTIRVNREFIEGEKDFVILYADNLTNVDLSKMINFHREHSSILTMGLFQTESPQECGIALVNSNGRILEFTEKPDNPKSTLANAGIYIANQKVLDYIPEAGLIDFGHQVLPQLAGQMYGYEIDEFLIDIGTISKYRKAQEVWKKYDKILC